MSRCGNWAKDASGRFRDLKPRKDTSVSQQVNRRAKSGDVLRGSLNALHILIVEDDPIIALDLAKTLTEAGAVVVGPANSVAVAIALIDERPPDLAMLDWRLETETSVPIAYRLTALGVPFLFHTSSRPDVTYPNVPIVDKPTRPEQLVQALRTLRPR